LIGDECVKIMELTARDWTIAGNKFDVRHHEVGTVRIEHMSMIEFFFFEMLVLIRFILSLRQELAGNADG